MTNLFLFLFLLFFGNACSEVALPHIISNRTFPDDFYFGVSTSAYQIEGAWNKSGKAPNIWDHLTHDFPFVFNGSTGDVACDSYHRMEEDIDMLKHLGVNFYRFSISWSRLTPKGLLSKDINQEAVKYYHDLLDKLNEANITSMVTIFHFDSPLDLHELGLFVNSSMNPMFLEYAKFAFDTFGSKVKYWATFNEPSQFCGGLLPMLTEDAANDPYKCMHNTILKHAKAFRLYEKEYKAKFKGEVTMAISSEWNIPKTEKEEDKLAAERKFFFEPGWTLHPLVYGDYHDILKKQVRKKTPPHLPSRLPEFTEDEKKLIKGTLNMLGLNYYTPTLVHYKAHDDEDDQSYKNDKECGRGHDPEWESTASEIVFVLPHALRNLIHQMNQTYNLPIFITENGYVDDGTSLADHRRSAFLQNMLNVILETIYTDGIKIMGYSMWSLMDNFEWFAAYRFRYGLYHVNFTSPGVERSPKASVKTYRNIIANRCVMDKCLLTYPNEN